MVEDIQGRHFETSIYLGPKKIELERSVIRINSTFEKGGTAIDVLDDIRKFPRPIAVDFNYVIANNRIPLLLNPEAPAFLRELRQIGNVFIATAAQDSDRDNIREFLLEQDLWTNDIVLMTRHAYKFITDREVGSIKAEYLRKRFFARAKRLGWQYSEDDLNGTLATKVISPLFAKPFDVPLIDDFLSETKNNPGMLGIYVQAWGRAETGISDSAYEERHTLAEAVNLVRNHYDSLAAT